MAYSRSTSIPSNRDPLVGGASPLVDGVIQLSEAAGIGMEPDWPMVYTVIRRAMV